MRLVAFLLVVGAGQSVWAEGEPVIKPAEPDQVTRDKDRMQTDANAGGREGFVDPGAVGGNSDSVIKGDNAVLPEGITLPLPLGGRFRMPASRSPVEAHGFLHTELLMTKPDSVGETRPAYKLTFVPRETELDITAHPSDTVALRIDLNFQTASEPLAFNSLIQQEVFDLLVEQAYAEWSVKRYKFRGGKFDAPFGIEPLDAVDRVTLTRSNLSVLAAPDLLTGVAGFASLMPELDAYLLAVNGWDLSVDRNRSKTLGGGLPHRFGDRKDGSSLYRGNLSVLAGVEKFGVNELRWLIDYSGQLQITDTVHVAGELAYGWEDGEGYTKQGLKSREVGRSLPGVWYGSQLSLVYEGDERGGTCWDRLNAELRLEIMRDPDLTDVVLHLPNFPGMTTLVGATAAVRYELARGLEAALEYRSDFERGDVENVSVQRNYSNIFQWFITQQVLLGVVGYF